MAGLRLGRDAKVYISDAAFTAAGLIEVDRAKDITVTDEAAEHTASARDMEYDVADVGSKTFSVEFDLNIYKTDPANGTAHDLLRDAYDGNSELFVIVTNGDKAVDCGSAIKFKGKVFKWPSELGATDFGKRSVLLKNTDPDSPPTRVTTPLA